jgi:inosose dehydratase
MTRRGALISLAGAVAQGAARLPANRNVKWALSAALWNHFRPWRLTDIMDVMKDTGFIGMRLTGYPGVLKTYDMTAARMRAEFEKRGLHVVTISFNGPLAVASERARVLASAREAMKFLADFGARHLVVFSPSRADVSEAAFREMCARCNQIGEAAGEMGFTAGLHNHLNQMAESPAEVERCLALTDPKLFGFSPDTAHLQLAGADVVALLARHMGRIRFLDYKDARWTTPAKDWVEDSGKVLPKDSAGAKFLASIYDLGDGEIDFPACHRILKKAGYRGWICVDLDTARQGPRVSYERQAGYVVKTLEPIYL